MKTMKFYLLALLIAVSFASCKKGPQKLLVKKWKLTEIVSPKIKDEQTKKQMYASVTFDFKENGNYDIAGLKDGGDQGKWELSKDGKTLTTKSIDGKGDMSVIELLTEEKLVLTQADMKMTMAPLNVK